MSWCCLQSLVSWTKWSFNTKYYLYSNSIWAHWNSAFLFTNLVSSPCLGWAWLSSALACSFTFDSGFFLRFGTRTTWLLHLPCILKTLFPALVDEAVGRIGLQNELKLALNSTVSFKFSQIFPHIRFVHYTFYYS